MAKRKTPNVPVELTKDEHGNHLLTVCGKAYRIDAQRDMSPANTIRRSSSGILVCDRRRDFGGCGKDAVKLEINVPLVVWLQEIHAEKIGAPT